MNVFFLLKGKGKEIDYATFRSWMISCNVKTIRLLKSSAKEPSYEFLSTFQHYSFGSYAKKEQEHKITTTKKRPILQIGK